MGNNNGSGKHQPNKETIQKMIEMKDFYLSIGLEVIPLVYETKKPMVDGYLKKPVSELWENIEPPFNIGLRLGKVCDLENDDEIFGERLDRKLAKLLPEGYPRYKSKRGWHRLIIVKNAPDQSNIHWKDRKITKKECAKDQNKSLKDVSKPVHTGELRINNCQSVIPFSIFRDEEGNMTQYEWCGDYKALLSNIPSINWNHIRHMVKTYDRKPKKEYEKPPLDITYRIISIEQIFIETLKMCAVAKKGSPIIIQDESNPGKQLAYKSRSEAEAAVVARMITCGYQFESILSIFENIKPGNYYSKKPKNTQAREEYLQSLYQKILESDLRLAIKREYDDVKCLSMADQVYCILLSLAFQNNKNVVIVSYEQLSMYLNLKPNSKTGPHKSCIRLEKDGLIKIEPGSRNMTDKKASKFTLLRF